MHIHDCIGIMYFIGLELLLKLKIISIEFITVSKKYNLLELVF